MHSTCWWRFILLLPFYILLYNLFTFSAPKNVTSCDETVTVFAWDFHEVLVNKQKWPMLKKAFGMISNAKNKWPLIRDFINPWFWADVKYARKTYQTTDGIFEYLVRRHPELEQIIPEFNKLLKLYTPNDEMLALLDILSAQGYRHYLASNISALPLADMQEQYPELFARLAGVYRFGRPKPSPEYFVGLQEYIRQMEDDCPVHIIFIDDMNQNIQGAMSTGNIDAIHFISPRQLRQELQKKGFSIEAELVSSVEPRAQ